jgi:benzoyl-CoA reductase/2-hydroxyglutaryl-CoA dehydratase subunit BcrC/BadD/HgdB
VSEKLAVYPKLGELQERYYKELFEASSQGRPVAWITSMAPIEILYAMDVFPVMPENYAALCASRRLGVELCEAAEAMGYSGDLCSYAKNTFGSMAKGTGPFDGKGLPRPDLLIATGSACSTHIKWFQAMSRYYGAPLLMVDAVYSVDGDLKPHHLDYFARQLEAHVEEISRHTGHPFDMDRLQEVVAISDRTSELWYEFSELRGRIPTPVGAIDVFTMMFPLVTLCGKPEAIGFYEELVDEVRQRVEKGIGVVPVERVRLMWDIFPIWYNLKLFMHFESRGAVFVTDLYADAFAGRLDPSRPFESLARRYLNDFLRSGVRTRFEIYRKRAVDYKVQGAVFHSNRCCRYFTMGQLDVARLLRQDLNLPILFLDADMADPRVYDDARLRAKIDAFLEMFEA